MIQWNRILEELAGICGVDRIRTGPDETVQYAVDGMVPKAVLFPKNIKMTAALVRCALRNDLALVPWGKGTKIAMGNPPKRLDLVLCTARMNHMLDVDPANLTITVEAGVRFRDLQARLATEENRCYLALEALEAEAGEFVCSERSHSGCFLPLDPPFSEKATMGGIMATNSSGPRRLLYGLPRDLLLGVRFVTPGGEIIGAGGKTVKNVSGYDISKLMIGAMGSLGILCEMTLKLLPLPERMETLLFSFESFTDASAFASAVFGTKLLPAALEVADRAVLEHMDLRSSEGLAAGPYVAIAALEAFDEAVARMKRELQTMARHFRATGHTLIHEDKHSLFWMALGQLQSSLLRRCHRLVALRLSYPLSSWKTIFEFSERTLSQKGLKHALLCHSGSGVSLVHILLEAEEDRNASVIEAVGTLLAQCRAQGGNLLVERAPVDLKSDLPLWGEPGSDRSLMKRIRCEMDPSGLINPGRFCVDL